MMTQEIPCLPGYPTTQDCKALSASQVASLHQNIAAAISIILALPAHKRDTPSTRNFLLTYAKDTAFQTLQGLIWQDPSNKTPSQSTGNKKIIHQRCLLLAEKLASSSTEFGIELLLDLAIVYARLRSSQIQSVFLTAFKSNSSALTETVSVDLVPGFTTLLSQQGANESQGLYAMRKVAECIFTFLRASGGTKGIPEFVRPFAYSKPFILAFASFYDSGLTAIASAYGGLSALTAGMLNQGREPDEWETIWVETKVALLDAFHIIITTLLEDLALCPSGPRLAFEANRTFDVVFALLQVPSSSSTTITSTNNADIPPTPFLNRPLLADYQESYSLSKTLAKALRHAQEKDARLDLLENTLQSFNTEVENHDPDRPEARNPGALKILLRSSGVQPGIDNRGTRSRPDAVTTNSSLSAPKKSVLKGSSNHTIPQLDQKGKAKAKAAPSDPSDNIDLDLKTIQVLDILPDLSSSYVRLLLTHGRYDGDAEKVVAALLEGTALSEEDLEHDLHGLEDGEDYAFGDVNDPQDGEEYSLNRRRNVFDDEVLDVNLFRTGKKTIGEDIFGDKAFIEEMKADILRLAEAISDDDEDENSDPYIQGPISANTSNKGKSKVIEIFDDDDAGLVNSVRIVGDGEESDVDSDEGDEEEQVKSPEMILELTYLRDPKVFDRDAATRRSKARTDLKTQTGWDNEQIEGWRVMLERNPAQKERMLQKHAFSGNEKGLVVHPSGESRGRGRSRPRGGQGRGGRGGAGTGAGEDAARERAWKDKNKATRGNHNRKRGHDKKMAGAKAGPGPST